MCVRVGLFACLFAYLFVCFCICLFNIIDFKTLDLILYGNKIAFFYSFIHLFIQIFISVHLYTCRLQNDNTVYVQFCDKRKVAFMIRSSIA